MNKKILYLFLALLLPVLIFLFLKYFGKNEFDIPVYYEHGVEDSLTAKCGAKIDQQYFVSDSAMSSLKWNGVPVLVIDINKEELKALEELLDEKDFADFRVISLSNFSPEKLADFRKCILFMRNPWNTVLIDNQKRIRGYYKIGHRDDMDRLEVELKILLKKY
jgi:hypothetical protein